MGREGRGGRGRGVVSQSPTSDSFRLFSSSSFCRLSDSSLSLVNSASRASISASAAAAAAAAASSSLLINEES